ncbi:MAG: hypothetical protein II949_14600 [Prevotella sp.]|nr:hypothetical protein [Prevotella sp.]
MMKKKVLFGMMGAMALAFTACTSEEELAPVNPTFDGKAIKTEFALNLPGNFNTRMKVATTQGDASFRGIDEDKFFIYAMNAAQAKDLDPVLANTPKLSDIELDGFSSFDHQNAQDKWYTDIQVPVGTNAFLVYAAAPSAGAENVNGVLNKVDGANPQNMTFELSPIAGDINLATAGKNVLDALNSLPAITGLANASATEAKAWSAMTAEADNQYYAELYTTFTSLTAGSYKSVKAFLEDLKAACAVPTGAGENGIDVKLAAAVDAAITTLGTTDFTATAGIPDGAAVLKFADGQFSFDQTKHVTGNAWGVNTYTFPAELWYRVNTGIRVDEEVQQQNVGDQTWAQFIGSAYTATNNAVKATSQSIALVNPLQYAVGNLETQIKFANENMIKTTTKKIYYKMTDLLDDNGDPVYSEEDPNAIVQVPQIDPETGEPIIDHVEEGVEETVPVNKLKLTGILIGDQKNVDWQALPIANADAMVIYDTDLIATTFSTAYDVASQTLVLETAQDAVNVALEFQNDSEVDFTGVNNCIIPAGTKFYLIGKLDISEEGKNYKQMTEGKATAIFQQDFKTIAKFTINTLENTAYNIVPDLRTPKLEFGLSVDLEWQKGYEFEIGIGEAAAATTGGN